MTIVNIATMQSMILKLAVGKRRPLWVHGPAGVGKSEGTAGAAVAISAVLCDVRVSQYDSVDFRGNPSIDHERGLTVWNLPATIPFKGNPKFDEDGAPIILFLDEMDHADPSVAAVCYQLCLERRVGEHILMDNVAIVAASNNASDKGVHNRTPAPLNNRFNHIEVVPDVKTWSPWAAAKGYHPELIGFLNFRSELFHTWDPANPQTAFATGRTWSYVNADMKDPNLSEIERIAALSGAVGDGPAAELMAFMEMIDAIVPIEEIIADPLGVPVHERLDMQWAMATHIAGNMDKTNAGQLQKFLDRLQPEMVIMAWTLAIGRDESITDSDAFLYQYAPKYRALFTN